MRVHIDFETRSAVDLRKAGLYRYFQDESTSVWVLRYQIDDGDVEEWRPGWKPLPWKLFAAIDNGATVVAHNAAFERECWAMLRRQAGDDFYAWPELTIQQMDCTMARAAAMALPASLEGLGTVLGLPVQKDAEGRRLMLQMCKADGREWADDRVARLSAYCETDVIVEAGADKKLPRLSARERKVWELDQEINDRGVAIDVHFAQRAFALTTEALKMADREMWRLTDGEVSRCTETAKLVSWLTRRGVHCSSVAKGEVEDIVLKSQLMEDPKAEAAILLRRASAKSSTAKYTAMVASVCNDGRVRGTLRYHGASTGRWAGSGIQPQNFPRLDDDFRAMVPSILDVVKRNMNTTDTLLTLELMTDMPALAVLSKMLRPTIMAGPDKKFVGGDYSNIEGRVNAWLAGEDWKTEAFADFDRGMGSDLYNLGYARAFGVPVAAVTKDQRQIGKVMELALGYQGGVGAFQKMASGYGLVVSDERAEELKRAWRNANSTIVESWWALEDAAIGAVAAPGMVVDAYDGKVQFVCHQGMLMVRLPSTRCLHYHAPKLERVKVLDRKTGEDTGKTKRAVSFWGNDSMTKRWAKSYLYGGLLCENIVQATARDIMVEGMFAAERAEFPISLTVHDELLTEPSRHWGRTTDANGLKAIMETLPGWAKGLPLAAGTWEDERYVK